MKYLLIIISLIFFFILYSKTNDKSNRIKDVINILVRQAARWSLASNQDKNPMIAVLHANYGAGYLYALRDIATDNEIIKYSGIDLLRFKKSILDSQDRATRQLANICPGYLPENDEYLFKIGSLKN